MRVIVDLDGTICDLKKEDQSYSEVSPKPGAQEVLNSLREEGNTIIIYTARHMKTCGNDVELVKEKMEELVVNWLERHSIYYDELIFGKPYGDVYIDDLAVKFKSWDQVRNDLNEMKVIK